MTHHTLIRQPLCISAHPPDDATKPHTVARVMSAPNASVIVKQIPVNKLLASDGRYLRQKGFALLTTLWLFSMLSFGFIQVRWPSHQQTDATVLAQARQALLAWSINYYQKTGGGTLTKPRGKVTALPCPDLKGGLHNGASAGVCGQRHHASLGLLPWRSLGHAPLHDASRNCLWYWVSGYYKSSPYPEILNAHTASGWQRNPNGLTYAAPRPDDQSDTVAAIVFTPGKSMSGQQRSRLGSIDGCPESDDHHNYLESIEWSMDQSHGVNHFKHFPVHTRTTSNDRMIYLTHHDLWQAVAQNALIERLLNRRLPELIAECMINVWQSSGLWHQNHAALQIVDRLNNADGFIAFKTFADDYIHHPSCRNDRRLVELNAHWGHRIYISRADTVGFATPDAIDPDYPFIALAMVDALPSQPTSSPNPSLTKDVIGRRSDLLWHCVLPAEYLPCSSKHDPSALTPQQTPSELL